MPRQEPEEYQFIHRRAGHVMVAYDNRLFVWGGYMELPHSESYTLMTPSKCLYHSAIDVFMYDPLLNTWTRRMSNGHIPLQLSGSCAAVHHQHMYLFGGWTNNTSDEYENSSNSLWRLHLPSLTWELLFPEGIPPFPCDKAACWVFKNRFYVFGGFGPARELHSMSGVKVTFVRDNIFPSGWIDQLVYYDIENNKWVWPETQGPKPSPRAAHTADVTGDKVFIFGGRFKEARMNDLHCLDLTNMIWSGNLTESAVQETPEGRSWHTFNFVSENKAVIYGGFNTSQQVLNDCWLLKVEVDEPFQALYSITWREVPLAYDHGVPRCWHTAAVVPPGELYILSGLTQPYYITMAMLIDHAEDLLVLRFSPPSLQRLGIEVVGKHREKLQEQWHLLPQTLQHILEVRSCSNSINNNPPSVMLIQH
ncbi:kelch domain-containing protein 2 isoform X1 [Procambarus clarkii]|uniref:kelch domain-containing protein 2 isoform X1 n=1 Tax=Procambarus clarkii TaxID=6728 RepID=UPI0037443CD7